MDNIDKFKYTGPDLEYRPPLDGIPQVRNKRMTGEIPTTGYADLDYLQEQLDIISNGAALAYSWAEKELAKYSLKVDTEDAELVKAHDLVYPSDTTPGYITFDEYKYLLTTIDTAAVQYVQSYYEAKLRGPNGSTSLDVLLMARVLHAEVARIRSFITNYIGELDETAEFRTVELFQDWTENTKIAIERLQRTLKTKVVAEIPKSELDQLDGTGATDYQVLFQTKLNGLNKRISQSIKNLDKNWNKPSESFYNKVLGPALKFQHGTAARVTDPTALNPIDMPTLAQEAKGIVTGLAVNFTVALSDQMRRNQMCDMLVEEVLNNIDLRDVYRSYIDQLSDKGTKLPVSYVDSSNVEQADAIYSALHPLSHTINDTYESDQLRASHQDLSDRLDPAAHPQYLLKTGGTITGDIELAEGVKIGGIILHEHKHNGLDGSSKISGSDIIPGTISPDNVSSGSSTAVPKNLTIAAQTGSVVPPGLTKVNLQVGFQIENTANIVGYEFEVIKLPT